MPLISGTDKLIRRDGQGGGAALTPLEDREQLYVTAALAHPFPHLSPSGRFGCVMGLHSISLDREKAGRCRG